MIQIRNLHYSIGQRRLLDGVDWLIHPGRHMALIGPNGAGKTTLLRILCGELQPDNADCIMPKGIRIGYLPQEETDAEKGSLLETVMKSRRELADVESRMEEIHRRLEETAAPDPALLERLGRLEHQFASMNGYEIEHLAKRFLSGLGFREADFYRMIREFSGGRRMRAVLAGLLLQDPDILLLDEPTNHLDLPSLEWLEQVLLTFRGSLVIVSHDRFFIDRLATDIYELDNGRLTHYPGNYHQYEKAKAESIELLRKKWKEQQDELRRQQATIDRFRYKATKAAMVQSRLKQMEKTERILLPEERRAWSFHIRISRPSYKDVIRIRDMSFRYDRDWVLEKIDLSVYRGEKIAMVGENGAGKTTLTLLMHGDIHPQEGHMILGQNVTIGYYSQHQIDALDLDKTVMEEVAHFSSDSTSQRIRNVLGIFQFSGDDAFKKIRVLSGGEKARVSLAKMLLSGANFLIMDEPTNHLDIISKEALEQALQAYPGTLLLISHDRYFLSKLVQRVLEVRDRKIFSYEGSYGDFVEKKNAERAVLEERESLEAVSSRTASSAGKKSREQRRLEAEARDALNRVKKPLEARIRDIEERIRACESGKQELETRMADPETYRQGGLIGGMRREHDAVETRLKSLYAEWENAHEELEKVIRKHSG
ncbi:ABC-F family ATP-binding cassette domain-containing protein [bacterium]|nr:ABC-F family ATP-binding cassette domain-containing protein [bacterium]